MSKRIQRGKGKRAATPSSSANSSSPSAGTTVVNGLSWYGRFRSAMGLVISMAIGAIFVLIGLYMLIFEDAIGNAMIMFLFAGIVVGLSYLMFYWTRKSRTFSAVAGGVGAVSDAFYVARLF